MQLGMRETFEILRTYEGVALEHRRAQLVEIEKLEEDASERSDKGEAGPHDGAGYGTYGPRGRVAVRALEPHPWTRESFAGLASRAVDGSSMSSCVPTRR